MGSFALVIAALAVLVFAGAGSSNRSSLSPHATVFATGLDNPRGLTFGPDGNLYVAEGGVGGSMTTDAHQCQQVPPPACPYSAGFTARISKLDAHGLRSTVVDGLPSDKTSDAFPGGGLVSGVADVEFVGGQLYALISGAGCSHGLAHTVNNILRVDGHGTTEVANLSAFLHANPVAHPDPSDFEPDGNWYSMVAVHGDLFAVSPNQGEVDRISMHTGSISRVVDLSASVGSIVPTAITSFHGDLYLGNLGGFPVVPDQAGKGRIVRVDPNGHLEIIATGFTFPTAMTFGPDGALYVSNNGAGSATHGQGEIVRVTVPN